MEGKMGKASQKEMMSSIKGIFGMPLFYGSWIS
jgi:hypothetical protein